MEIITTNPFNLEKLKSYKSDSLETLEQKAQKSMNAFSSWKNLKIQDRMNCFSKLINLIEQNTDDYSFLITQEMGKLLTEASHELNKSVLTCNYYLNNIENFLENKTLIQTETQEGFITYQPLGPILAIMPWNFPFWQVLRCAIPTLLSGNTFILKHASNVSGCSLELEKLFLQAGFPEGVFQSVITPPENIKHLISNKNIRGVTLTGSTQAGQSVASIAGQYLKKCVLELGGSDPYILCEDANIEKSVELCFKSRIINAGQSCIAAKRWFVHTKVFNEVKNLLTSKLKNLETGDPLFQTTTLAPLASIKMRDQLHTQVLKAQKEGATVSLGGEYPLARGAFYSPTIIENIKPDHQSFHEEFFGPVISLFEFKNLDEAIQLANGTDFGLGAAIFTQNLDFGKQVAESKLEAGSCFVNQFVKSTPELPFGGIKNSGYGRELSSHGVYEFMNIKTVIVNKSL